MVQLFLVLCLAVTACDVRDFEDPDPFVGAWALEYPNGCVRVLTFDRMTDGGRRYESNTACPVADRTVWMEVGAGTYTYNGTTITLIPTHTSCDPEDAVQENPEYVFRYGFLRLLYPYGAVVLRPWVGESTEISPMVTFGCFRHDGSFTPQPVVQVQTGGLL